MAYKERPKRYMKMGKKPKTQFWNRGRRPDGCQASGRMVRILLFLLGCSQVSRGKSPSLLRLRVYLYDSSTLGTSLMVLNFFTSKERPKRYNSECSNLPCSSRIPQSTQIPPFMVESANFSIIIPGTYKI